jgi:hypothetical protein
MMGHGMLMQLNTSAEIEHPLLRRSNECGKMNKRHGYWKN